jgi:hypothetical protein
MRNIKDAELKVEAALPGTGATINYPAIDIGNTTLGVVTEQIEAVIAIPALPNLADTKTITFSFDDSDDNISFAAVKGSAVFVATGAGGAGAPAEDFRSRLPETTRQYVRIKAVVATTAGDSTGSDVEFTLRH